MRTACNFIIGEKENAEHDAYKSESIYEKAETPAYRSEQTRKKCRNGAAELIHSRRVSHKFILRFRCEVERKETCGKRHYDADADADK